MKSFKIFLKENEKLINEAKYSEPRHKNPKYNNIKFKKDYSGMYTYEDDYVNIEVFKVESLSEWGGTIVISRYGQYDYRSEILAHTYTKKEMIDQIKVIFKKLLKEINKEWGTEKHKKYNSNMLRTFNQTPDEEF